MNVYTPEVIQIAYYWIMSTACLFVIYIYTISHVIEINAYR